MTFAHDDNSTANGASVSTERCLVIHPNVKREAAKQREPSARLEEILGLALAIDLNVVHADIVTIARINPASLFGKGTVERIGTIINGQTECNLDKEPPAKGDRIDVSIIDAELTPVQQRNLETAWKCKVIDRTGLILEIFGERARTREGRLQVDLAAQTYLRSRLVRTWTHLERQRGGAGFMGGPGETQIETDRRLIDQRITRLKRELKDVKRTRELHRKSRRKVPFPVIALVGYTNAGKSTLFNFLTKADVVAKDQLFATLDPTMRELKLPSGRTAILSDTVGFISDLPHELVQAFHATLEEVIEAEIIIHVRDCAHPDTEAQKKDVHAVLNELGIDKVKGKEHPFVEALNKIDVLDEAEKLYMQNASLRADNPTIGLSALTGNGCDELLYMLDKLLSASAVLHEIDIPTSDGATLAWLYQNGEVIERMDTEESVHLKVRLDPSNAARFTKRCN